MPASRVLRTSTRFSKALRVILPLSQISRLIGFLEETGKSFNFFIIWWAWKEYDCLVTYTFACIGRQHLARAPHEIRKIVL